MTITSTDADEEIKHTDRFAKRSEILFLYDSRMSNPNGDPDENKPRFDEETKKIYVTEFRLKRTIRKYLNEVMGYNKPGHNILLRQELDENLEKELGEQGFKMLDKLSESYIDGKGKISKLKREELLAHHVDIRLFGILFAVGKINFKQTGPVQFGIGQSLNTLKEDTDIIRVGMTSLVPNTKNEAGISKGGSFGEKWIVRYAFIQHHGFVNNNIAKNVKLTESDVKTMITAMWNGTDALTTTSKFGQKSRLLIKVNYKDNGFIGDLDLMTMLEQNNKEQTLENITQVTLNIDKLLDLLKDNESIIDSVEYKDNPILQCVYYDSKGTFETIIKKWSKDSKISISNLGLNVVTSDEQKTENDMETKAIETHEADSV
jgi:CRISPR-associated protein Csh2